MIGGSAHAEDASGARRLKVAGGVTLGLGIAAQLSGIALMTISGLGCDFADNCHNPTGSAGFQGGAGLAALGGGGIVAGALMLGYGHAAERHAAKLSAIPSLQLMRAGGALSGGGLAWSFRF